MSASSPVLAPASGIGHLADAVRPLGLRSTPSSARRFVVGVVSTFPPTQCGLATFTAALIAHLGADVDVRIVRAVDPGEPLFPEPSVRDSRLVANLVAGSAESRRRTARALNECDVVLIQHEYGIFGGPSGTEVLDLTHRINRPIITVLHTVLTTPSTRQRVILETLIDASAALVTMTGTARSRLIDTYGAPADRVHQIPHGAAVWPAPEPVIAGAGRPLILTWGLIGPGKGIESAIAAVAMLRDLRPRYLVVGQTHPKVLVREGEAYRDTLIAAVDVHKVTDLVELDNSYVSTSELAVLVARADVVLLPYDSREQVTSGVLIEAVAAGRPVVSTAFPHAVELLSSGAGLVVAQQDTPAMAAALRRVLTEPEVARSMAARAAQQSPELSWAAVGDRYARIVRRLARSSERRAPASRHSA